MAKVNGIFNTIEYSLNTLMKAKKKKGFGNFQCVIAEKHSKRPRVWVMQRLQFSGCHTADQKKLQAQGNNNTTDQLNHLKVRNAIVF